MLSLFADQEREAKLDSLGDPLALLNKHVDFRLMAEEIDRWVPRPSRAKGGRPPYPTELMTRLLVLQQLLNLSDEQMEFQLLDRMSFQRFAGLKNTARVPDRNTIWNFREWLVQAKVEHLIFDEVQRQLQLNGFNAREGQIINASIVRAPIQHNTAEQQGVVKQRAAPIEWEPSSSGDAHERQCAALPTEAGSQPEPERAHCGPGTSASSQWRRDDLFEAAPGW